MLRLFFSGCFLLGTIHYFNASRVDCHTNRDGTTPGAESVIWNIRWDLTHKRAVLQSTRFIFNVIGELHLGHCLMLTLFLLLFLKKNRNYGNLIESMIFLICSLLVPRRFKWNSSKNLCQYSAKYWHEEKTWTATRYYYWD